jgi:hypothetical protein
MDADGKIITLDLVRKIMLQILSAVSYFHSLGIIHRLDPARLLMSARAAVLLVILQRPET